MKKYSILIALLLALTGMQAQLTAERTIFSPSGGFTSSGSISFSYTAGEPQIGTTTSGTNSFLVGFQVPSDMTVGIEASLGQGVEVSIFPNPVSDEMYIEFEGNLSQTVYLQLYDAKGSVVEGYDFQVRQAGITSRNLSALTSGTYFLRLSREDGQLFKTLPLIKL